MIKSFNSDDNLTSPKKIDEDIVNENSLRPLSFNDFIGQKNEIEKLKVFIKFLHCYIPITNTRNNHNPIVSCSYI